MTAVNAASSVGAPIVVKLGSALIAESGGRPRRELLAETAAMVDTAIRRGERVCIVSSGAIALGSVRVERAQGSRGTIGELQAASALGQAELQRLWQDALAPHDRLAAQVLLTAAELEGRRSYLNLRNALQALFQLGAVPIVNENDATATDEISFGDNDILAGHLALLLRARRLVLLTRVDGVLAQPDDPDSQLIADGRTVQEAVIGAMSPTGRGGISSKIRAAELASAGGVETIITSPAFLAEALVGERVGTFFPAAQRTESAFKVWLRYGKRATAGVEIDAGAQAAIVERGGSLLAVGVVRWSDNFRAGDCLDICDGDGTPIARGISEVDSDGLVGRPANVEVVHRDKLVVL